MKRSQTTTDTAYAAYLDRSGFVATLRQVPYRAHLRSLDLGFVLDVGCGTGRNLAHLNGRGIGIDHNATSVEIACDRGFDALTVRAFAERYPKPVPIFDTLVFAHVLEHVEESLAHELLRTYAAYVKSDGRLLLITPQRAGQRSDPTHVRYCDFAVHRSYLEVAGFSVDSSYSFPFPRFVGNVFVHNEFVSLGHRMADASTVRP